MSGGVRMGLTIAPGATLNLVIADPFELSTTTTARVVALHTFTDGAEQERMLILLATPLKWAGTTYNYLVLERRSSPGLFDALGMGAVEVNGYGTLTPESPPPCVNGQVAVPTGGQLEVPTPRGFQLFLSRVPPFARACLIR